eukprot:CFRG6271T1
MKRRMKKLKAKGCIGFEVDNIMVVSKRDKNNILKNLEYGRWLAKEAHRQGLLIIMKNGGARLAKLEKYYDAVIAESPCQFNELESYKPYADNGKNVWIFEYKKNKKTLRCKTSWLSGMYYDSRSGWRPL